MTFFGPKKPHLCFYVFRLVDKEIRVKKAFLAMKVYLIRVKFYKCDYNQERKEKETTPAVEETEDLEKKKVGITSKPRGQFVILIEGVGDDSERAEGPGQKHAQL